MKCLYCGSDIPDNSVSCPECGGQVTEEFSMQGSFCPKCGSRLEQDAVFCPACGARVDGKEEPKAPEPSRPKGKGGRVVLVFLLIALAIVAVLAFGFKVLIYDKYIKKPQDTFSAAIEELDRWADANTEKVYQDMQDSLNEDNQGMSRAEEEKEEQPTPTPLPTATPVPKPTETPVPQNTEDSEYVLPQSDKVLLSRADVASLSLRELNYAKNEIYARHGRLFQSRELQDYFNSKSWYHGSISPDSFSESLLSEVERKNVLLLRDVEFSINPNGYQLDAK